MIACFAVLSVMLMLGFFAAIVLWCLTISCLPAVVFELFSCDFLVYVGFPFSGVLSDVCIWFHFCSVFLFYACRLAVLIGVCGDFWAFMFEVLLCFCLCLLSCLIGFSLTFVCFQFCNVCLFYIMFTSVVCSSIYMKNNHTRKNNDINLILGTSQPKWRSKCTYMVSM